MAKNKIKYIYIFAILALVLSLIYLTIWIFTQRDLISGGYNPNMNYVYFKIIKRRSIQLIAIIISTLLITSSSLVFQTITKNKILTPSVLGFDSIFLVTQTLLVLIFGATSILVANAYLNFTFATLIMIFVTLLMYKLILRKNRNNVILLLLMGMVIASLAGSITNFVQVFMHPDEFQSVQGLTTISLTNINESLVFIMVPLMLIILTLFYKKSNVYDVMALGEDQAISLGVNYNKENKLALIYIAISVAISTALIGPLAFLGLIAVNTARELFKTSKHKLLFVLSGLFGIVVIMLGQVIVELLDNRLSVSVLISLIGGTYMIYLIIKENKL